MKKEDVQKVLDELRPTLQADGGDAELIEVNEIDGVVKIKFHGACVGCPFSTFTLQEGIARAIKSKVKGIKEVKAV